MVDDGGDVCAASGGFVAQLRTRTDDDGSGPVPGVQLLEAVHAELTTREAHLRLLRVCSATLRDGEEGVDLATDAFASAADALEPQEQLAEARLEAGELRAQLRHVAASARETERAAAAEREELHKLRAQLAAALRRPSLAASRGSEAGRSAGDGRVADGRSSESGEGGGGGDGPVVAGAEFADSEQLARGMAESPSAEEARRLVEAIRREKLVHEFVAPELRHAVAGLTRSLNQAIELLAKDIYSSDARFVSELLQVACPLSPRPSTHRPSSRGPSLSTVFVPPPPAAPFASSPPRPVSLASFPATERRRRELHGLSAANVCPLPRQSRTDAVEPRQRARLHTEGRRGDQQRGRLLQEGACRPDRPKRRRLEGHLHRVLDPRRRLGPLPLRIRRGHLHHPPLARAPLAAAPRLAGRPLRPRGAHRGSL